MSSLGLTLSFTSLVFGVFGGAIVSVEMDDPYDVNQIESCSDGTKDTDPPVLIKCKLQDACDVGCTSTIGGASKARLPSQKQDCNDNPSACMNAICPTRYYATNPYCYGTYSQVNETMLTCGQPYPPGP